MTLNQTTKKFQNPRWVFGGGSWYHVIDEIILCGQWKFKVGKRYQFWSQSKEDGKQNNSVQRTYMSKAMVKKFLSIKSFDDAIKIQRQKVCSFKISCLLDIRRG